ncbi:MAG: hybrid sensor histidine kinase/response regulator [Methanocalculus sp. MSAO_Arc2]|uniref:hybrid sensor histidine kinase/response regulator n=1 Tax=Methanocalculus sp. MSAO_Arc2 TaxID=2293855 RepID=UPI000FED645D|nr:MAG: hybrid sensor histidine kinase/response regulator [Methanocalculus sp. MSAO_Arc2]
MAKKDQDLKEALLATFRDEADEILTAITSDLISLEKGGTEIDPVLSESIYRRTHSLKGAARAISLREIESICQHLETALSGVRNGEYFPDAATYDLFHRAVGQIRSLVAGETGAVVPLIRELRAVGSHKQKSFVERKEPYSPQNESVRHRESGTVRIATKSLDRLIGGSDELLSARLSLAHRMRELNMMMLQFSTWQWAQVQITTDQRQIEDLIKSGREMTTRDLGALDRILQFLRKNREFIDSFRYKLANQVQSNARDRTVLEAGTKAVADTIHDAVLIPFLNILEPFQLFIRDAAGSSGKQVEFMVDGGEIEIDRRVLEALKDPLLHIIRNAIDHGIEHPGARISRGKSPRGKIHVRVVPLAGSRVGIDISDDGNGINPERIRQSALQKGMITTEEAESMSDEEALNLALRSGLSTSTIVTKLSGRGLGLAIVEDAATSLGGTVSVTSIPGENTCVRMSVPVRLSNFRGIVVRSGRRAYVMPMQQVKMVIRTKSGADEIRLGDELVRLVPLCHALGAEDIISNVNDDRLVPTIILASGAGKLGVYVDEIVRVQEIVLRPLGSQLRYVKRIAGAGILDDGTVALIIDPLDLISSSLHIKPAQAAVHEQEQKNVLVVEDSVTSREFLRSILEKEGYGVEIAKDGAEALQKLKQEEFDIVISDVDMPGINGFALTEAIKKDVSLFTLPVVLVTSLDSPRDQEYGIHLGADAYIIKSMFEKNAFLKLIREVAFHES